MAPIVNFAIVATVNDTSVTVTVPGENEQAYVLDAGQVLHQSRKSGDVTGTSITSDQPVSVFGSNDATQVGAGACCTDYLVEQLPPTSSWGTEFFSIPLASRIGGDTFRMLAATDGTILSVNGATVATLSRGEFHEQNIDQAAYISSNFPISVAQFSNVFSFDGINGDPSMILTPPVTQFDMSYVFEVPDPGGSVGEPLSYDAYINVVAPWATVDNILLDGRLLPPDAFVPIADSGFAGGQFAVVPGPHQLQARDGISAIQYGFGQSPAGYGSPLGGFSRTERLYVYDVVAVDADNDTLTYSLVESPRGMRIHPETGQISWIPRIGQPNDVVEVTVRAADGHGGVDDQTFLLEIFERRIGEIRGMAFDDLDGDGQRDSEESGLGGRVIYLDENNNARRELGELYTTTDDNGDYAFIGLSPGAYIVREECSQVGSRPHQTMVTTG